MNVSMAIILLVEAGISVMIVQDLELPREIGL